MQILLRYPRSKVGVLFRSSLSQAFSLRVTQAYKRLLINPSNYANNLFEIVDGYHYYSSIYYPMMHVNVLRFAETNAVPMRLFSALVKPLKQLRFAYYFTTHFSVMCTLQISVLTFSAGLVT